VPRVLGLTEKSREVKNVAVRKVTLSHDQFMTRCTKDAAELFNRLLEESNRRQFVAYWGTVGFSIRARVATSEREHASFLYCWPPNILEIYLAQLPLSSEDSQAVRQDLLRLNIFQEAGDWTLRTTVVDEKMVSQVWQACLLIFDRAATLVKTA